MPRITFTAAFCKNEASLKKVCFKIGDALGEISLQSQPDKTEVVVTGRNKRVEAMRKSLMDKPAGKPSKRIKFRDASQKNASVRAQSQRQQTVKHRVAKAWGQVADIKTMIRWLRARVTLTKAVIILSFTCSGDMWLVMNNCIDKFLKDEYKGMVTMGLGTGIGDWDWGLGLGIGNWEWENGTWKLRMGKWEWEIRSTPSPKR